MISIRHDFSPIFRVSSSKRRQDNSGDDFRALSVQDRVELMEKLILKVQEL